MNAIGIKIKKADGNHDPCTSKFFGAPVLPDGWPEMFSEDIIFFGQIRLSDIAELDTENKLPHDMIHSNTYCAVCKASILESLPNCCDCVYQPYCGVCPVINLAIEHDVISKAPNNYRCKIYSGMLDTIFELLQNETVFNYLEKW